VLSDCKDCNILAQIQETAIGKYEKAVKSAQELWNRYFDSGRGKQRTHRKTVVKEGVLKASAKLAVYGQETTKKKTAKVGGGSTAAHEAAMKAVRAKGKAGLRNGREESGEYTARHSR